MSKPDEKTLLDNIGKVAFSLDKAYMSRLSDHGVLCFDEKYNQEEAILYDSNIRAVKVDRWVFDREEKPGECFKNVLSTFSDGDHTIALVVKRTPVNTEMYFVVKNEGIGRNEDSRENAALLRDSIQGNFQGSRCTIISDPEEIQGLFSLCDRSGTGDREDGITSISLLTNMPSEYARDHVGQGLDKLLNGIVPESKEDSYTVVFLAESLTLTDIRDICSGYEEIATALAPYLQYQFQSGSSETETHGEMESISDTESISNSIFKTHSVNIGVNGGVSRSRSISTTDAVTKMIGTDLKGIASAGLGVVLGAIGGAVAGPPGAVLGNAVGKAVGTAAPNLARSTMRSKTQTDTTGQSLGLSAGYGYSWGSSKTVTNSQTRTKGTSSSVSKGKNESTTYTYKSYLVAGLLERLERTIDRIDRSQATGLWKYSTYVLGGSSKTTKNVANYLKGITQGMESHNEPAVVQEWSRQETNHVTAFGEIKKYVSHFTHPVFVAADSEVENTMIFTPTSYVATDELSHVVVFPRKSLQGIPVLEGVAFGREPHSLIPADADLEMGNGYHMHRVITQQRIKISKEELTKHTFITGSTGSGKSNTIYKMLENLDRQGVRFLVVEPAKGEYRTVFGGRNSVRVYGTNPNIAEYEMLRINPFRFPRGIHILEHLDHLVEIFNVCWPMYAAMPAILKDSVERAYVQTGWDLERSVNVYDEDLFPTFADVVGQVRAVLEESDYSDDNRGDYTGSLVTRLKSLTNGINGLIFTSDDIADEDLFDQNVIVDLSRVGSSETKSLIMGLLVLKLQEYRMDQRSRGANTDDRLRHITVLEEAHNLLKRTSTEQTSEGSNMLGKSVEMLANSIAEMRTYGEGFMIADQSPGLLDMSVIRNTNTKIILRLPDFSDRELVGRAAGLSENQIVELARLEKGVAAISQSDWLEPVLCKIDKYDVEGELARERKKEERRRQRINTEEVSNSLLDCIMTKEIYRRGDRVDVQKLRNAILRSRLDTTVKRDFIDYINTEKDNAVKSLRTLVYDFLNADQAVDASRDQGDIFSWVHSVADKLSPDIKGYSKRQIDLVMALLVYELTLRNARYNALFCRFAEEYREKGGIF